MALTNLNVVWLGQPGSGAAQGQIYSTGLGGPVSRSLEGIATITLDGVATTGTINWIDGVQAPYKTVVVVPVLSVAAPVTINGVASQAVYSGVGAYGQFRVGQSITFAGFSNAGNNGAFTINAIGTGTIQVTNAGSVVESNPAATATGISPNSALVAVAFGSRAMASSAGVLDTAANSITATLSAFTQTGCTVTLSAAGTSGQTLSVFVTLYPSPA